MTEQAQPHIVSLSAELARPQDDVRCENALRWNAALHSLCTLRATFNETTYAIEWARIMEHPRLVADLHHSSKFVIAAALDVIEAQTHQMLLFCRMENIAHDDAAMVDVPAMLEVMREALANEIS